MITDGGGAIHPNRFAMFACRPRIEIAQTYIVGDNLRRADAGRAKGYAQQQLCAEQQLTKSRDRVDDCLQRNACGTSHERTRGALRSGLVISTVGP